MSNSTDRRLVIQLEARIAELESICGNLRSRAEAAEECIVHQAKGSAEDEHRIDYFTEGRDAARADVVRLRELLRRVEWGQTTVDRAGEVWSDECHFCGEFSPTHDPDCELAAALAHDHAQTTPESE